MNMDNEQQDRLDAVLSRLPQWQPPSGFAARVAAGAVAQMPGIRPSWTALVLRGLGLAACVSIAGWLGGEVLLAGLPAEAAQDQPGVMSWLLAMGSLWLAWQAVRRSRQLA
jgi:hypothetical protein